MKFYFYANASRVSGSGHVMRMYALAEEAKARNVTTVLIGHIDGIPWLTQQKLKEVFDYILNDPNLLNSEITNSVLFWTRIMILIALQAFSNYLSQRKY